MLRVSYPYHKEVGTRKAKQLTKLHRAKRELCYTFVYFKRQDVNCNTDSLDQNKNDKFISRRH